MSPLGGAEAFGLGEARRRLEGISRVVLVGSGKGGVGKSFVACALGLSLAKAGLRTALFDVDIHGASLPGYLGVRPPLKSDEGGIEPKKAGRLRVMSVGLLTGDNPVPMRGEGKQSLITQLFALTNWGRLDTLVVDLPPSMGDELLSAFSLFRDKGSLVLVATPSPQAVGVVSRLRRLAQYERVRLEGLVLNMAYIQRGPRRVYPFGRPDLRALRRSIGVPVMAEIPLEPRLSELGLPSVLEERGPLSSSFRELADRFSGGQRKAPGRVPRGRPASS